MNDSVVAEFETTAADGENYQIEYCNLGEILSAGYHIKLKDGIQSRIGTTGILEGADIQGIAETHPRNLRFRKIILPASF